MPQLNPLHYWPCGHRYGQVDYDLAPGGELTCGECKFEEIQREQQRHQVRANLMAQAQPAAQNVPTPQECKLQFLAMSYPVWFAFANGRVLPSRPTRRRGQQDRSRG